MQTTGLLEGPPQQELDLAVDAPQIVVGPPLQGEECPLVEAEQEGFSFSHWLRPHGPRDAARARRLSRSNPR